MEYFREAINSTEGRKGKGKPPQKEYIRASKLKAQQDTRIITQSNTYSNLGNFLILLFELRLNQVFCSLRCQNQESRQQLPQPKLLPCCNAHTQIRNKINFARFLIFIFFRLSFRVLDCFDVWFSRYPGPLRSQGFPNFPNSTEIDSVNFGSHKFQYSSSQLLQRIQIYLLFHQRRLDIRII